MWWLCVALASGAELEALVDAALSAHPVLEEQAAVVEAAGSAAVAAGAWPDPMLGLEGAMLPVDGTGLGLPMTGVQLRLSQRIPGGREKATELARVEADVSWREQQQALARATLRTQVETAFWQLTLARRQVSLTRDHLTQAETLLQTARSAYEVGRSGQAAVLRLELLRGTLQQRLADDERDEARWAAAVQALTGQQAETPGRVEPLPVSGDRASWLASAAQHPVVARHDGRRAEALARGEVASARGRADVELWTAYRYRLPGTQPDPGGHFVSVGVGVPLPVGSARVAKAGLGRATAEASAASAAREVQLRQLEEQLAELELAWTRAAARARFTEEELLPAARAVLQTTLTEYQVGRADFASLFEAQVALVELERTRLASAVQTHLVAARVRAVTEAP